ncbi:MAG: hypothetical protein JSS20_02420 [Proteobacteria bacterium]|nr:hypothetical protein [Pseudomonadota bacterium]
MPAASRLAIGLLALLTALGLGSCGPAISVKAEESWETTLKLQLESEQRCVLERFVSVRQQPAPGLDGMEGRVHCADGREFDFTRQKAHQKFEIRICQPAVC